MLTEAVEELEKTLDSIEPPQLDEQLESHLSLEGEAPALQRQPSLGRKPSLQK